MKVRQQCVRDAINHFYKNYPTSKEYECRIILCSGLNYNYDVEKGTTFQEFLQLFRKELVMRTHQLVVLDKDDGKTVRLSYLQKNQIETVLVEFTEKDRIKFNDPTSLDYLDLHYKFRTIHEKVHPFIEFLYKNSHALITLEQSYLKYEEGKRFTRKDPPKNIHIPFHRTRYVVHQTIRFMQSNANDSELLVGIPYYKEVVRDEKEFLIYNPQGWMTDLLFVREPYDGNYFKLTIITGTEQKTFLYKKGSFVPHATDLSASAFVEKLIAKKYTYIRSKLDVVLYRDVYKNKRPVSVYLERR